MDIPPKIAGRIAGFNTNESGVDSKIIDNMIPDYKKGKRLVNKDTSIIDDRRNYEELEKRKTPSTSSSSSRPFQSTMFIDAQPSRIKLNDNQEREHSQLNPETYRNSFISDSKISEDAMLIDEFKIDPNIVMNFSKEDQEAIKRSAEIAQDDDIDKVYDDVDKIEILTGGIKDSLFDTLDVHKIRVDDGFGDASSGFTRGSQAHAIQEIDLENIDSIAQRDDADPGGLNIKVGEHKYPAFYSQEKKKENRNIEVKLWTNLKLLIIL